MASGGREAISLLESSTFEIVITDLKMPDVGGLEVLAKCKELQPDAEVILVTGHGTIESAVEAMQRGAFNYLLKPLDLKQLRAVVENAARSQYLRRANAELHRRLDERFGFEGVIGNSPQMHDVVTRLQRIAPTDATVLIQGETGTGKELVAKAIHQNSPRKKRPFVPLNCAALSEHILESELFGHIRGAFTDASSDRQGKFEYADGGTLFLDEVGDMPIPTQIKLLRVLESGEITRVGSNEPVKVNVRILSATNRDLEKAIADGTFREDLYHRLKVVTINLPRLAERREDIPLLIDYFRQGACQAASENDSRHFDGGAAAAAGVRLAGQRAAAAQRDREHGRRRYRRSARRRRLAGRARADRRRGRVGGRGSDGLASSWSASRCRRSKRCSSPKRSKSPAAIAKKRRRCSASASGRCIGRSRNMGCREDLTQSASAKMNLGCRMHRL